MSDNNIDMKNNEVGQSTPLLYCWNNIYPYELLDGYCEPMIMDDGAIISETLHTTADVPPPKKVGYAICRDISDKRWVYIPDYRGKRYWTEDMTWLDPGIPIMYPGELPEGSQLERPRKPCSVLRDELELEIKKQRRRLIAAGIEYKGTIYSAKPESIAAYANFILEAMTNPNLKKRWKASYGNYIDMTIDLCKEIQPIISDYIDKIVRWEEEKLKELAKTPDEKLSTFII